MTLRHLKIFVAVVDAGTMTAASKTLYMTQPSVSQAIRELESHYGAQFFDRISKRLYLTDQGTRFLSYARHILSLSDEMEMALAHPEAFGTLKVGATLTIGNALLPSIVHRFQSEFPKISLQLFVKNTDDIEQMIIGNTIDLGLVEGYVVSQDIVQTPLASDSLALVCGRSHPLYGRTDITERQLAQQRFIVREPGSGTRALFENAMRAQGLSWTPAWECSGSDIMTRAAAEGLGIAVLSERLIAREIASGTLWRLPSETLNLRRQFSIVYHKNKYFSDIAQHFIRHCESL